VNLSFNWLSELVDLNAAFQGDPRQVAEHLTLTAAAVEKIEPVGQNLDGVVVARVLEVGPHPNADRLSLCKVDRGDGSPLDVVCGAPVIVKGALYPHVAPGESLPGGFAIESRKIRGEMSHGMLCSDIELELGRDKSGIMRLDDDLAPGIPLGVALGLPDTRLALDLNPNRVDLACHLGVARELAAPSERLGERDFGANWQPVWCDGEESASGGGLSVRIEAPDRCSRYTAAVVRGVTVGPSPAWLVGRLLAVGARPVNNVVDSTNYVLLERNQPLHAFDLQTLTGQEIRVRSAADGEKLTTLDGQKHKLTAATTVIADQDRAIALAGVMGGRDTEVTADTVDVVIECAAFDPAGVRATAGGSGLATDASYRFERGIDVHAQEGALRRCVELILATAGGEADGEALRVGPSPAASPVQELRLSRVHQLLGLQLEADDIAVHFEPIGLREAADSSGGTPDGVLRVQIPGWRTDIRREIDLVEEVARRVGYERFPDADRRFRTSSVPADPDVQRAARVRRALVAEGLFEARSLSFMPGDHRGNRAIVAVPNPLSSAESYLRAAMVPVLIRRLEHNFSRGHRDVRLFEIGTVFDYSDPQSGDPQSDDPQSDDSQSKYREQRRVGVILTGGRRPSHWSGPAPDLDLWDAKGMAERVAGRLCNAVVVPVDPGTAEAEDAFMSNGWLAPHGFRIERDGQTVGVAGPVRASAVDSPPWAGPAFGIEFRLDAVQERNHAAYRETSAFPSVRRDLSVTVPAEIRAGDLEIAVRKVATGLLEDVRLFDVYAGEELGKGRRALGWAFRFRAPDRTLTDEEVDSEMASLSGALEEQFDAKIRSS